MNPAKKLKSIGISLIRTGNAAIRPRIARFFLNDFGRRSDFLITTKVKLWHAGSRDFHDDTGAIS
jgi:hypothetical protein